MNASLFGFVGRSKKYIVPGNPIPLQRVRLTRNNIWDPQKEQKLCSSIHIESQHDNAPLFYGPVHVDFLFYFAIPKSKSSKKKHALIDTFHYYRPDTSNLVKFYEDIAHDILYDDDCIIASLYAKKLYAIEPRTEIIVTELK